MKGLTNAPYTRSQSLTGANTMYNENDLIERQKRRQRILAWLLVLPWLAFAFALVLALV